MDVLWRFLCLCAIAICRVKCKKPLFVGVLLPSKPNPSVYSRLTAPAVQLAAHHINASPDILPDYEIVLDFKDSECNIGLAGYQLYRLLSGTNERKVALIGEACSTVTQPLAQISQYWNIPQFNFLSTSPALDNTIVYPHYYHVLPSEDGLNPSRAAMMRKLGWSHSLILVEPSHLFDLNAKNLRNEMIDLELSRPEILVLSDDFQDTIEHIKEEDVRILFGLFYEETGRQAICSLLKAGIHAPEYVWVFVGWYHAIDWYLDNTTNCTRKEMAAAVNGHFTVDFAQLRPDHEQILPTGKTVEEVGREFQRQLNHSTNTPISASFQQYSAYGYDLTVALGLLFDKVVKQLVNQNKTEKLHNFNYEDPFLVNLIDEILKREPFIIEGLTGKVAFFNYLGSQKGNTGRASGLIETYYNRDVNDSTLVFRYDNINASLTSIGQIRWTTSDKVKPVDTRPHTLKYSNDGIFIFVALMSSLCIIITIGLLVFTKRKESHWAIKESLPYQNKLLLSGAFVTYVSVILYGFDGQFFTFNNTSIVFCFLRTVLLTLGFTVSFGTLLIRTATEVIEHFLNPKYTNVVVVFDIVVFALLLLVDALVIILWFAIDPWKKGEQILEQEGRAIFTRNKCASVAFWGYIIIVYKLLVLIVYLVAAMFRYKIYKSRATAEPSYTNIVVCITALALGIATIGCLFISNPGVQYVLVSICLISLVTVALILLFGKKAYIVWKGLPEPEKKQSERDQSSEFTEKDRGELKELRKKSSDLMGLVDKLVRERPVTVGGPLANEIRRVVGYVPGEPREGVIVLTSCKN